VASAALLVEIWRLWLAGGAQQPEERRSLLEVLRWAEPVVSETASFRSTSNKPCAFLREQDLEEFLPLLAGLGGEEVRRFVFRRAVSVLLLTGQGGGGGGGGRIQGRRLSLSPAGGSVVGVGKPLVSLDLSAMEVVDQVKPWPAAPCISSQFFPPFPSCKSR
jgi:hypothetical protein